jgi:peptidoglycan-associated lipoprotein
MMKKTMNVLIILGFIFSAFLLTTSCAKKQVQRQDMGATDMGQQETSMEMTKPAQDTMAMEQAKEALMMEAKAFESENIHFDFDSSELKPEAQALLTKKAAWLRGNPGYKVKIDGHCDERGTSEYNLALGERRANSAAKFLSALGVSGDRITTVSYGEEKPADMGRNETAWAKNRRDEFKLMK